MEIEDALKVLLTPDGKGIARKGKILSELCNTKNANYVREAIVKFLKENK